MHHIEFLQDLAVVMIVAALATILFRQMKQPVVLGYILAGVIIGPHTPPFSFLSGNEHNVETLAELGIIFLMFTLGLEFSLRKLQKVGATAFIAAALEILLMCWAGYHLGRLFGWSQMDSVFLGAILSISSTTIIIKALEGLGKTKEKFAGIIFGILIVEDILAIVMLALLSGYAATGQLQAADVSKTVLELSAFLGVLLVGGLIIVPRLLNYVAKFKSDEMLVVTVIGLCFGVSLVTVKLGYSVALGAFLIGAIIAEARQIAKIEALMMPIRDLFSAVFFVSIGLLIDPQVLGQYIVPILVISVVVIVGKVITCSIGCFIGGHDLRTSMKVGFGLAQIGEFSFIIASLGLTHGVTSDFIYPIAVAVSAITTLTTPYLIKASDPVVGWFDRIAPKGLTKTLEAYSQWVGHLGGDGRPSHGKILGTLAWQIGLNLLLVTGIFIPAAVLHSKVRLIWADAPGGEQGTKTIVWLAAMLISFPLLVAVWRKIAAGARMIAEISVTRAAAGPKTESLRGMVSSVILGFGSAVLLLMILLLSSAVLPSRWALLLAVALAAILGVVLYRGAVKIYARGQVALHDTFAHEPEHGTLGHGHGHAEEPAPAPELPPLLRQARLESVTIGTRTVPVGKMLSELGLRTETGASIVGIDRKGTSIINPSPYEELADGDELLLIGSETQLESARKFLAAPA
jgi:CPA2 family monovalent cation:H+ antiporter-2